MKSANSLDHNKSYINPPYVYCQVQFAKMFAVCKWIIILIFCTKYGETVIPNNSLEDTFRYCLLSQAKGTLGHCFGVGAINKLQSLENSPEFDLVDGVTLTRDAREFREVYNFAEGDPTNFR